MFNPTVDSLGLSGKNKNFEIGLAALVLLFGAFGAHAAPTAAQKEDVVRNNQVWISFSGGQGDLWEYGALNDGAAHPFAVPEFEIDGKQVVAEALQFVAVDKPVQIANGVTEHIFEGTLAANPHLKLRLQFQVNTETPVIRFRYTLKADKPCTLTAPEGENRLIYFKTSLRPFPEVKEISLSNFVDLTHSYTLGEQEIAARDFENGRNFMGPILAASDGNRSFLVAYEHGSEIPFAFLHYQLDPERDIRLTAVKGNYFPGQTIDADHSYSTVWMETAAVAGNMDQLASTYRRSVG